MVSPNPFWVAVVVVAVALLFVMLAQMATVRAPSSPPFYSVAGQQDFTGFRASDVVFADPYNPDLAFFPSENTSCATRIKSWDNTRLSRPGF